MNILVTGNLGYIGSVLTEVLGEEKYNFVGFDIGYFEHCNLYKTSKNFRQINKDIRLIDKFDLKNINCVIHLSGLSNDPLGEFNPLLTDQINFQSTVKLAKISRDAGVKKFINISSQSMYGISNSTEELDEHLSKKNPITEYAKTKWKVEQTLNEMNSNDFQVTHLRPSTVFGASPRLRCDIVFNNLVASAFTTGEIKIKSDGSPWRPVVHVRDLCSAIMAVIKAPEEITKGKTFNVGIENGNYTVRDIANNVKKLFKDAKLTFTNEHTDPRSYKVSFKRILTELKDYYKPKWNLELGGKELIVFFKKINFKAEDFQGYKTNRLKSLKRDIPSKYTNELKKNC